MENISFKELSGSDVYCHGVHLDDEGQGVLADNYFDLIPVVGQSIVISHPTSSNEYPLKAILPISAQAARAPDRQG